MARSVLFVEDDPRVRRVAQMTLAGEGFEVGEAPSGEQALQLLARRTFDVVLLDLGLPDLDGFEVSAGAPAAPATLP